MEEPMEPDRRMAWALCRYQVISAYLALDPPRGQRRATLELLARRTWNDPDGEPFKVAAETIRVWLRRYRRGGLDALQDARRPDRGTHALTDEQLDIVRRLKREVPERSLDRIIAIAEQTGLVEPGVLRRSTVHRALQAEGLSARPARDTPPRRDLDRWEAAFPNDLWQSDMLAGPWLPDPDKPGKMRRAWLFAWLDDHSRLLLHGRFDWNQGQPALELAFRRALQKWGIPRRCYFDNGKIYRSRHTARICAHLGVHRLVFTRVRRPEGHGKIEAFNRFVRSAFIPELAATSIVTLDQLNEAFVAWLDLEYNARVHSQTGQTPLSRWREAAGSVRYATDAQLRQAFLFCEKRTPDKAGVFSLCGTSFQVGPTLARRRVEVRFDPEALFEVEVWRDGAFVERAQPLRVGTDRRPWRGDPLPHPKREPSNDEPTADWLGYLVEKRRADGEPEPSPRAFAAAARDRRRQADEAVLDLLRERLAPDAFDPDAAVDWLHRYGPLDPDGAATALDILLAHERPDHHVTHYLDALRGVLA
jgi:putative transposase